MILVDNKTAADALRKMASGGLVRGAGVQQDVDMLGFHYFMDPATAELGLKKFDEVVDTTPKTWVTTDWPDLR